MYVGASLIFGGESMTDLEERLSVLKFLESQMRARTSNLQRLNTCRDELLARLVSDRPETELKAEGQTTAEGAAQRQAA
jgi:hypothetical protein